MILKRINLPKPYLNKSYLKLCSNLYHTIDKEYPIQLKKILHYESAEHDPTFLGFIQQYEALSRIIPRHFIILDLGCGIALQAWYFRHHKEYLGVDTYKGPRLQLDNVIHFKDDINQFIADYDKDPNTIFTIVNYVPISTTRIRKKYNNLFIYYPTT